MCVYYILIYFVVEICNYLLFIYFTLYCCYEYVLFIQGIHK
jgi:hypothetical protein